MTFQSNIDVVLYIFLFWCGSCRILLEASGMVNYPCTFTYTFKTIAGYGCIRSRPMCFVSSKGSRVAPVCSDRHVLSLSCTSISLREHVFAEKPSVNGIAFCWSTYCRVGTCAHHIILLYTFLVFSVWRTGGVASSASTTFCRSFPVKRSKVPCTVIWPRLEKHPRDIILRRFGVVDFIGQDSSTHQ